MTIALDSRMATRHVRTSAMALVSMLAACAANHPGSQAPPPGGNGGSDAPGGGDPGTGAPGTGAPGATPAAFDCNALEGPLSTNRFYEDNPTYTDPVDDSASWTTSTPEAQGVDSGPLDGASIDLDGTPFVWSFLVIRHDTLVYERYYHGSARNQSNNVHSASKSIWGAALGVAIDKGLIPGADATLASTLPANYTSALTADGKTIEIRDLLTMTSGIRWTEDTTENQIQRTADWTAAILQRLVNPPSAPFNYSTGNTHLFSAALATAAQTTACEFIHKNLLAPMGIVAEHWGRDPQGYFSGGYNLYLTPRELAKFGLLYLHDGKWNGTQLVPAAWVQTSMTNQVDAGEPYSYGYNFWLRDFGTHHAAMAWGFGGQMVYIIKDLDLVVVMTTNTHDFDQDDFDGTDIIANQVIPAAGG